jgi:hypothetical protein
MIRLFISMLRVVYGVDRMECKLGLYLVLELLSLLYLKTHIINGILLDFVSNIKINTLIIWMDWAKDSLNQNLNGYKTESLKVGKMTINVSYYQILKLRFIHGKARRI